MWVLGTGPQVLQGEQYFITKPLVLNVYCLLFLKPGSHYAALAGLELTK